MQKLPLDRATWPFIAFTASAAMLATAHAFERFLLLAPCPLCYNDGHGWLKRPLNITRLDLTAVLVTEASEPPDTTISALPNRMWS